MRCRIALLGLAACNPLFGLHETRPVDAPPAVVPPDALEILIPPDGSTTCSGTPVDFSTWTFDQVAPPPALEIVGMAVYPAAGTERVVFTANGTDPTGNFNSTFDWDFAGTPVELASLRAPPGASLGAIGVSPDGNTLWLVQTMVEDGVYYATRDSGWTKQRADLGMTDPDPEPSSIGFYDGTARMVIASNGTETAITELASADGVTWTPLPASFPAGFGTGLAAFHTPALTPDGCVVVFEGTTTGFEFNLYVAYRDATGAFGSPVEIVPAMHMLSTPALSADRANLWFTSFQSGEQLFHGHP